MLYDSERFWKYASEICKRILEALEALGISRGFSNAIVFSRYFQDFLGGCTCL
jgi:hypothetical protein